MLRHDKAGKAPAPARRTRMLASKQSRRKAMAGHRRGHETPPPSVLPQMQAASDDASPLPTGFQNPLRYPCSLREQSLHNRSEWVTHKNARCYPRDQHLNAGKWEAALDACVFGPLCPWCFGRCSFEFAFCSVNLTVQRFPAVGLITLHVLPFRHYDCGKAWANSRWRIVQHSWV